MPHIPKRLGQLAACRRGAARLRAAVQEGLRRHGREHPRRVARALRAEQIVERLPDAERPLQLAGHVQPGPRAGLHVAAELRPPAGAGAQQCPQTAHKDQRGGPRCQHPPCPGLEVKGRGVEAELTAANLADGLAPRLALLQGPSVRRGVLGDAQEGPATLPGGLLNAALVAACLPLQVLPRAPGAGLVEQQEQGHLPQRILRHLVLHGQRQQQLHGVLHAVRGGEGVPGGQPLDQGLRVAVRPGLRERTRRVADPQRDLDRGSRQPCLLPLRRLQRRRGPLPGQQTVPAGPINQVGGEPSALGARVADRRAAGTLAVVRLKIPAPEVVDGAKAAPGALEGPATELPLQLRPQVLPRPLVAGRGRRLRGRQQ
mmetsp:Transcript_102592/g.319703  ORF Transcript_102592/g.319703 Transcript_102592/m.319703 type:complete len:372 (+) Transcript_102592:394-1509(+)